MQMRKQYFIISKIKFIFLYFLSFSFVFTFVLTNIAYAEYYLVENAPPPLCISGCTHRVKHHHYRSCYHKHHKRYNHKIYNRSHYNLSVSYVWHSIGCSCCGNDIWLPAPSCMEGTYFGYYDYGVSYSQPDPTNYTYVWGDANSSYNSDVGTADDISYYEPNVQQDYSYDYSY